MCARAGRLEDDVGGGLQNLDRGQLKGLRAMVGHREAPSAVPLQQPVARRACRFSEPPLKPTQGND